MKRTYSNGLFLFFVTIVFCVSLDAKTAENFFNVIASKAIRPDSPALGSQYFPASCGDCCNDESALDCRLVDIESLLEVIEDEIILLTELTEFCCGESESTFGPFLSTISALAAFDQTCCANTTSSLDGISSQLDVLADCACCQNVITQADINAGDYTITAPGVYCLDSDVTFSTGNAITISNITEQVILDLQGHTINASGGGVNDAILVAGATGGVTIRNGAIVGGVNGIELFGSVLVFIKNLDISAASNSGIFISNGSNGVEVYDVFIHNSGVDGFFASGASLCKLINSTVVLSNNDAVHLDSCSEWTFDTVRCVGNGGYGFHVESTANSTNAISYQSCTAESCVLGGFFVSSSGLFNTFNINYLDCKVLSTGGSGFSLLQGGNPIQDVIYRTCISSNCQTHGFTTGNGVSGPLVQGILFDTCTGSQNVGSGFFVDCFGAILKNNVAELNGGDGITLTTSASGCQVLSSSVVGNSNIGINDANTVINNIILSNVADANGANYSPIVPLKLFPTDITGHWINVDSTASTIGEYEQKIDAILECSCCENIITPAQIIAGGYTITGSGIYCLGDDVVYANGPAITISAPIFNQIILDLGGHTITCDPITGVGPTIQVNGAGTGGSIIIRNGATSGGDGNIILNSAQSVILENLRFNFTSNGMSVIVCDSCDNVLINDVEIRGSAANGIEFASSTHCFVTNSLIESSSNTGIYVTQSINCTFENVKAFNNSYGFIVDAANLPVSSFGIAYKSCIAESNHNSGFYLANNDVSGSTISSIFYQACQSVRNGAHGFAQEANGVRSEMIENISYQDCTASENDGCGYFLNSPAINNGIVDVFFTESQAQGNSAAGYYINAKNAVLRECLSVKNNASGILLDTLSSGCQVIESNTAQNNGYGIQDDGTSNLVYSNVASENIAGNYSPSVPLQLKPTDITGYWINVDPTSSVIGEYESKIDALIAATDCSCCPVMITNADIAGGNVYVITQPGQYCLAEDVTFSTGGFAIQIFSSAGEVVLDLNGHTITGSGGGNAVFINTSADVSVLNGGIVGVDTGIAVSNSTRIHIKDLNIKAPVSYGVLIYGNSAQTTVSNIIVDHAGIDGICVQDSAFISILDSEITQNAQYGVRISNVSQCNVESVRCIGNGIYGFGIDSAGVLIEYKNCSAEFNAQGGFVVINSSLIAPCQYIRYTSCNAASSIKGFSLLSSPGATINSVEYIECTSVNNQNGFEAETGSAASDIIFTNCIAHSNSNHGFLIDCINTILKSSIAEKNSGDGILLTLNSSNCQVLGCNVSENSGTGIEDLGSSNLVYSNTALGNGANYGASVPLTLKPTDITGYWINVDPTSSVIGEYESKIDSLASCGCCPNIITQATIDAGNVVITAPGIYCLGSDISFSGGGIPITINNVSSEVILDLGGYTITDSGIETAILISGSTGGAIIRNGTISNVVQGILCTSASSKVLIEDINIYTTALNGAGISIQGGSSDIVLQNIFVNGASGNGIEIIGCTNCFVKNSVIERSSQNGIFIAESINCGIENVQSFSHGSLGVGAGFLIEGIGFVSDTSSILFKNCTAQTSSGGGFVIETNDTGSIIYAVAYESCVALQNDSPGFILNATAAAPKPEMIASVSYINCLASGNVKIGYSTGDGTQPDGVYGILYDRCQAVGNTAQGFEVGNIGVTLNGCIAERNGSIGFRMYFDSRMIGCQANDHPFGTGFIVMGSNALMQYCVATSNQNDGFFVDTTAANTQILNSYASYNRNIGINNNSPTSYIWGNSSTNNTVSNYGTGGNTPLNIAASLATPYWANVRP